MHPAIILVPVAAMILGPRIWVGRVLRRHNQEDENLPGNAADQARAWLDSHQLQLVKVELTDRGDHYDPEARAIRLSRDKFDRKSLTAVTTAAHEVSHALQDAEDYAPFVWRTRLAHLAMATSQVGTVVLLAVPAAALFAHRPIPPLLIGSTLLAMLSSGLVLQLASLQTELDASFKRALPMLQDGVVDSRQMTDAKNILIACSLTYVASSLVSVLNIWPWLGRGGVLSGLSVQAGSAAGAACLALRESQPGVRRRTRKARQVTAQTSSPGPAVATHSGFRETPDSNLVSLATATGVRAIGLIDRYLFVMSFGQRERGAAGLSQSVSLGLKRISLPLSASVNR